MIVFFLPALFIAPSLQAKPRATPEPPRPSIGHDVSTSVLRGGSCELDIEGIAMPGETVEFKVKKNPKHGMLEAPRRMGRESVSYTYRHNGKKDSDADRVEFGLKTGSGNAWGTLTARISIVEPLPMLLIEGGPLDFGVVPIGEQSSKTLKIRNAGAGVIRGKIKVYAPWSIEQSPDFELRDGDDPILVRVIFAPAAAGKISGRIEFETSSKPYRVDLHGEGVYRFQVSDQLTFTENSKAAYLEILNLDSKDLVLHVGAPPPLICESKITVPARGSAQLKLAVNGGIYTQKFVDLDIADGLAIRSVRVNLPPSPLKLEWDNSPVFDAGRFPLRNVPELQIGLTNAGATKAAVRLVPCEGGLRLAPSQAESFELGAGEKALVRAIWNLPENPGEARAKIAAMQGDFATELDLLALVEPAPLDPVPVVNDKKTERAPDTQPREPVKKKLSDAEKNELLLRTPTETKYRLVQENGAATAIFTWNYQGPKPAKFHLERKVVERKSVDPGKVFEKRLEVPEQLPASPIVVKWLPVPDSEAKIECLDGTAWQGRVPGLQSGFHEVRIVLRAPPDGKRTDEFPFTIQVGKLPPSEWFHWALAAIGFFCLLYLLGKKILKKPAE